MPIASPRFRPLTRAELDVALEWAAREGWNPGVYDAEAFWAADSTGFWGMEVRGELIGTASTVAYDGALAFVGLFIVHPEWRGRGLGRAFWKFFISRLQERLGTDGGAALDGVFAMQEYYARSGFAFSHRNLRVEGVGKASNRRDGASMELMEAAAYDFAAIAAYDRRHFGAGRSAFLQKWVHPEGSKALIMPGRGAGEVLGYGVVRPCRRGFKIGPLFADTPDVAETLFAALSDHAAGEPIFLDIPENNPAALALAARHGLQQQFGCARMLWGAFPRLPWECIYGVTTFELG